MRHLGSQSSYEHLCFTIEAATENVYNMDQADIIVCLFYVQVSTVDLNDASRYGLISIMILLCDYLYDNKEYIMITITIQSEIAFISLH